MYCWFLYRNKAQQATIPTKSKNALIVNCTWGNHLPTCLIITSLPTFFATSRKSYCLHFYCRQ